MADEQFVIFRLGNQDYGLPISAVDEIARPPERIARLPKAPAFVDGVMNLRGAAVPIIDLRRRFEIESKERAGSERVVVVAVDGAKTGFHGRRRIGSHEHSGRSDPTGAGSLDRADAPDRTRRQFGRD